MSGQLPAGVRGTVFRGSRALNDGTLTPQQLRGRRIRRLLRDVYADAALPDSHGVAIRAAALLMPPTAAIAGPSAAWLHGLDDLVTAGAPVEVVVPVAERFGPVRGLRIRTVDDLPNGDVSETDGLRRTIPVRTAVDLARHSRGVVEAVVCLDLLLRARIVGAQEVTIAVRALPRGRGCTQARRAALLADSRAESPQESRLRAGLVLRGVEGFVPQYVVRQDGRFVARLDLGDPVRLLALEYDGRWHAAPEQLDRDRRRLNALGDLGWRVMFVTAPDLRDLNDLARRVRAAQTGRAPSSPSRQR